jgi:polysaccharide export outer membrane protein
LGLLLGSCLLGAGCESLPHLPLLARRAEPEGMPVESVGWRERVAARFHHTPATMSAPVVTAAPTAMTSQEVLQPQSVVYWTALPGAGSSTQGYRGRSTVKPDGSIELGPYGSVRVAGLTPEQARMAVTRQVAQRLPSPRVTLSLAPPAQDGAAVAQRGNLPRGSGVQRTGHTAAAGPSLTDGSPLPIENRLVPAPHQGLAITPQSDMPSIIDAPASSPELPHSHVLGSYPVWHCNGPNGGGPGLPGLYGRAPNEMNRALLPAYIIEPPDILLIEYKAVKPLAGDQPIAGQHLVFSDGTVHLGVYGQIRVAGLTLEAARQAIFEQIKRTAPDVDLDIKRLNVDLLSINSKVYYVITDGGGYGEQVYRFPVTGNETVLDAISLINGLPPVASKRHIWLARRNPNGGFDNMYAVDWIGIAQRGATSTNYQIMPGDRVYVQSDHWRRFDSNVQKVLSPFERILGATLLGASTVQEIRLKQGGGTGGTGTGVTR